MQPNVITLAVDEANDSTLVDFVLTRFEEYLNRSKYIGADHTLTLRDELSMYRTFQKQNGNFKGVAKSSVKFTRDFEVLGVDGISTLTSPAIVEVSMSLPVGLTTAQIIELRQRAIALLDRDDIMTPLNSQLMV
jgi:hypothetical protein